MQSNDTSFDEIDEEFLAEALADLDIPDSEHDDGDYDDVFAVNVDDVLRMSSDPISPPKTVSSPPHVTSISEFDSPEATTKPRAGRTRSPSFLCIDPATIAAAVTESVSSKSNSPSTRRKSNSMSTSSSSRSTSSSKASRMNVVGTVETSEDEVVGRDFDNGAAAVEQNTEEHHTASRNSGRRELKSDFDNEADESHASSPSTPLVRDDVKDDEDIDEIYIKQRPRTGDTTTPTRHQSTHNLTSAPAYDVFSKSSPTILEDAANELNAAEGSSAERGEESVGSKTLEGNASLKRRMHKAPTGAGDTSLLMTDEDFLAEMAGFGGDEDSGIEGQHEYRGEGTEISDSRRGSAANEHEPQQSDSELLLMEEETAERARRVRALALARATSSSSAIADTSARNNELSRSLSSASGRSRGSSRSPTPKLSSFGSGGGGGSSRMSGSVLFSDDELPPNGGKKNGFEATNGFFRKPPPPKTSQSDRHKYYEHLWWDFVHMYAPTDTTEENNSLHSTITVLEAEKQALLDTISQLDGTIAANKRSLEDESEKQRKWHDDLTSESVVFRGRIELLETENMRFRDKEKILRDQFQSEAELSKQLREQLDTLQHDHDDLSARFQTVTQDYDTVTEDFDRLKTVATSQLQNAGELYSERVRELNTARTELSEVTSQRDTARLELEDAVNNLSSQQALKNKFQERAQQLEETTQHVEHERESLIEKLNEYRRTAEQTSSELQSALQLKEQFMNELIEQKEAVSRLRDQLDEQEAGRGRAAELEDSMAGLAAENRALKSRLFDDSEQIRKLQGENGELLTYVDQLLKESNR